MSDLNIEHFDQFFQELHGKHSFPWQRNLTAQVLHSGWPEVIDLPTASGKTACIDIALFALACKAASPRRIFFVVDRRVVVNEASIRMRHIAERLDSARHGVIAQVAQRFREMSGGRDAAPLSIYELRGGIYRDQSWVRSALQPAVITSTVDQVGSRLLFRGYGVTDNVLPIHAALIANDALILLDEAHCSKAFAETLSRLKEYRGEQWADQPLGTPFASVEMTATPSRPPKEEPFRLSAEDRKPEHLGQRLRAPKKTQLVLQKGKVGELERLARVLTNQALDVAINVEGVRRIAVMVNRVATARLVWQALREAGKRTSLVIGRMRPIDRDDLNIQLDSLKAGKDRVDDAEPWFIVATQCLEVGADLDFDALITECASMDALLQRFGRLDRLGKFGRAVARVVALMGQVDEKQPDFVYGGALAKSWQWLRRIAEKNKTDLNFGIEAGDNEPGTVPQFWKALAQSERELLTIDLPSAPVLLPSHVDALAQTSPKPAVEPSIDLFLHGPQRGNADIHVVWRADLDGLSPDLWFDIVAICPPVSAEAMSVPIWEFLRWLRRQKAGSEEADIEGMSSAEEVTEILDPAKDILIWRGEESTSDLRKLRPGDTVVIPAAYGGGRTLGHTLVDDGPGLDCGDRAFFETRKKIRLRLHTKLVELWPQQPSQARLLALINQNEYLWNDLREAILDYREEATAGVLRLPDWLEIASLEILSNPQRMFIETAYPANLRALAIEGRARVRVTGLIDGDGDGNEMSAGLFIALDRHLKDVAREVETLQHLVPEPLARALEDAARWHDCGKADMRFQTLLYGGDHCAATFAPQLLAKGKFFPGASRRIAEQSELPFGFRHELLSLTMVSAEAAIKERDVVLHLIASHHGRCRPLAPVVHDEGGDSLSFDGLELSTEDRLARAAHRLDSGVADRFWALTRRFGWWGLAYLEALLRLADWSASESENQEMSRAK